VKLDRRRPDLLVADGLIDQSLASCITGAVQAASFEEQHLGSRLYRYRERAIVESPALAAKLWDALEPHIGDLSDWLSTSALSWERPIEGWTAASCNPRSRIYRYHPGTNFAVHRDIPWTPEADVRSVLTVLVYLPADGCVVGETRVGEHELIELVDWRVAVFDHAVLHEGTPVTHGVKQVLRNDIIASWTGHQP
jgi:prolyl 4-hydroxylase